MCIYIYIYICYALQVPQKLLRLSMRRVTEAPKAQGGRGGSEEVDGGALQSPDQKRSKMGVGFFHLPTKQVEDGKGVLPSPGSEDRRWGGHRPRAWDPESLRPATGQGGICKASVYTYRASLQATFCILMDPQYKLHLGKTPL